MKRKKYLALGLSCALALTMTACGAQKQAAAPEAETQQASETVDEAAETESAEEDTVLEEATLDPSLDLTNYADQWIYVTELPKTDKGAPVYNEDGSQAMEEVQPCYALMDVPYCLNPADAAVQLLDIYVPEEYMDAVDNGDGTWTCNVREDGMFTRADGVSYTAADAPIIYQNTIDGYAQGERLQLTSGRKGNGVGTYNSYLESGYVLVSIGSRGTTSETDGTAPACVVDLKAGIRLIKANDAVLPGDADRIVATGTSAGGGATSVLGASGNSPEFDPYLEEIGAIMDASDDIYCALAFCPITNLGTGDAAFEWLHASETETKGGFGGFGGFGGPGGPGGGAGGPGAGGADMAAGGPGAGGVDMAAGGPGAGGADMAAGGPDVGGADMAADGPDGTENKDAAKGGPGADLMAGGPGGMADQEESSNEFSEFEVALHEALYEAYLKDLEDMGLDPEAFYQGFLDEINECITYYVENYVEDVNAFAQENPVLSFDGESFSIDDVSAFVSEYMARSKGVPSFDGLEYENKENDLFDGEHFSEELLGVLEALSGEYGEAAQAVETYRAELTDERRKEVELMTPVYFLLNGDTTVAPCWRFRIGTNDGDLGAVSAWTITQLLEKNGTSQVDYGLVWGIGHMSADYSYEDVQSYVDSICK